MIRSSLNITLIGILFCTTAFAKVIVVRYPSGTGVPVLLASGSYTPGNCLETDSNGNIVDTGSPCGGGGGSGTVTSVTFTGDGTVLSSTPSSAVTTTGTLTAALNTQNKNKVFIGPSSGSDANPTFRLLVGADLPNPSASTLGGIESIAAVTHNFLTSISTSGVPSQAQPAAADLSDGTTGSAGAVVLATGPTMSNPIVGTQTASDNSTKAASTAYVTGAISTAISGVNPAIAVQAATTSAANTSGLTYNNGVGGIGATLTGSINTAITIDGYTFNALNQRLLVKNDTQTTGGASAGAFNGIYYLSTLQGIAAAPIFTRVLDYDQPSDINNTGAIPVVNGTVNASTSWVNTAQVTTVGTDALVFAQFSVNPSTIVTTTRSIGTTSPITGGGNLSADRTIAINNAAADGSTLGAAAFAASDFNSSSGVISLDYANGQKASSTQPGFSTANQTISSVGVTLDGGGSALTTGQKGYITFHSAGTIKAWNITADTGTCTFDIWKIASGTAVPTVTNTITASAKPALATGTAIHSTTLSGWTTSVTANDIFGFNLDAVSGATKLTLTVEIDKS